MPDALRTEQPDPALLDGVPEVPMLPDRLPAEQLAPLGEPYVDAYQWRAIYDPQGNDVLEEHEADGTPHRFAEIDQARLLAFVLVPQWEGLAHHAIHLAPGQRLIWFRRVAIDANGPRAGVVRKAHVIGWQQTIGGRNVQSMTAIYDNGAALVTSDESLIEP